jgi:hypothetical protein
MAADVEMGVADGWGDVTGVEVRAPRDVDGVRVMAPGGAEGVGVRALGNAQAMDVRTKVRISLRMRSSSPTMSMTQIAGDRLAEA